MALRTLVEVALLTVGLRVLAGVVLPPEEAPWPAGILGDRPWQDVSVSEAPPSGDWTLLIGGSSAHDGFDTAVLAEHGFAKQTVSGGMATEIAFTLAWTLDRLPAERRPSRVIWAVNLASFVDRVPTGAPHPCAGDVAIGRPSPARLEAMGLCDDTLPVSDGLLRAWVGLDPWYGPRAVTKDAVAVWVRSLWGASPEGLHPYPGEAFERLGARPERVARNVDKWRAMGTFAAEPLDRHHLAALTEVVRTCGDAGVDLVFVSMPEHRIARGAYDPDGRAAFDAALAQTGAEVYDWFDDVEETGFYDQAHLNELGRAQVTAKLADLLGAPG